MIVIATDAPLSPRNLERMAGRAPLGLARAGSFIANGSGDFVIAFSTQNREPFVPSAPTRAVEVLHNDALSPLFLAVVEAVEEAVYNSLTRATDITGYQGRRVEAIPIEKLRELVGPNRRDP
jgi:D-aminopeptidase